MSICAAPVHTTDGHTVILTGATGCGKTWMACALAQYACRPGHSTRYLRVPRLAEEIRTLRAAGTYSKRLAQLAKTQVLVLDDWGRQARHLSLRSPTPPAC